MKRKNRRSENSQAITPSVQSSEENGDQQKNGPNTSQPRRIFNTTALNVTVGSCIKIGSYYLLRKIIKRHTCEYTIRVLGSFKFDLQETIVEGMSTFARPALLSLSMLAESRPCEINDFLMAFVRAALEQLIMAKQPDTYLADLFINQEQNPRLYGLLKTYSKYLTQITVVLGLSLIHHSTFPIPTDRSIKNWFPIPPALPCTIFETFSRKEYV